MNKVLMQGYADKIEVHNNRLKFMLSVYGRNRDENGQKKVERFYINVQGRCKDYFLAQVTAGDYVQVHAYLGISYKEREDGKHYGMLFINATKVNVFKKTSPVKVEGGGDPDDEYAYESYSDIHR